MEFSIRGIGIIKEADIKMDGLTVIAGSNNSGKTTVGRALYAVTSAVEDLAEKQQQDQGGQRADVCSSAELRAVWRGDSGGGLKRAGDFPHCEHDQADNLRTKQ